MYSFHPWSGIPFDGNPIFLAARGRCGGELAIGAMRCDWCLEHLTVRRLSNVLLRHIRQVLSTLRRHCDLISAIIVETRCGNTNSPANSRRDVIKIAKVCGVPMTIFLRTGTIGADRQAPSQKQPSSSIYSSHDLHREQNAQILQVAGFRSLLDDAVDDFPLRATWEFVLFHILNVLRFCDCGGLIAPFIDQICLML